MKKATAKFLAFLLILSACLTGCGNDSSGKDSDNTASDNTSSEAIQGEPTEAEITDDLPAKNYSGSTVKVAIFGGEEHIDDMVTAGEETGALLNDAVYRRNRAVEERFGITYEIIKADDTASLHSSVMAGNDDFEILFYPICYSIALSNQGDFLSTNELPYVNLDKPWWDSSLKRDLSIGGKLFFLTGDISPTGLGMSSIMLFNKNLFDQLSLEYPYQMVEDGTWTVDALAALINDQTIDLDGDGKISSAASSSDRFGLTGWMWDIPNSMFYGCGGKFVQKDNNDIPVLSIDIEKASGIVEKIYDVLITKNSYFAVNTGEEYLNTFAVFSADRSLFLDGKLSAMARLRDMESDFGILPLPKYNEAQDSYITFVNSASSMISVPKTVKDPEKSSVILEAMAAESYKNLTPDYKDYVLKGRDSRDQQSSDMVDIIIRNRVFDIAYIYSLPGYGDFVRPLIMSKSTDVASTVETYRTKGETSLQSIVELFK